MLLMPLLLPLAAAPDPEEDRSLLSSLLLLFRCFCNQCPLLFAAAIRSAAVSLLLKMIDRCYFAVGVSLFFTLFYDVFFTLQCFQCYNVILYSWCLRTLRNLFSWALQTLRDLFSFFLSWGLRRFVTSFLGVFYDFVFVISLSWGILRRLFEVTT